MAVEKKKWFEVEIPLLEMKVKLIGYSISDLNNRFVKLDLTRQLRGKSIEATVNIKVNKEKAEGEITKLNLLGFFIRRMMRTNIDYVEDSFSAESLDSIFQVKPFLITRKKVTSEVRKALRNEARKYLEEYFKDKTGEEILLDILNNKTQKSLSLKLKRIYPLALCEIRAISLEKKKEGVKIERVKKAKPEELAQEKSQIEEIEEELAEKAEKESEESEEPVKEKKSKKKAKEKE